MVESTITYNRADRRHYIAGHALHCGDTFEIKLAGHWVPCRYEANWIAKGLPTVYLCFDVGSFGELQLAMPALKVFRVRF